MNALQNWARGRFSMTPEEKFWLLVVLIIAWTGLLGRYVYLKNQSADLLTREQMEQLAPDEPVE